MRKLRVLILSEGFGSGHTQAARAISEGLKELSPSVSSRVFELGSFMSPRVMNWITGAYRKMVNSQPKLVGLIYKSYYKKPINRLGSLALHRILYNRTASVITQLNPDLIVCTHPMPNAVISRLKRTGLQTPLVTVITDYDAHGTWVSDEVNGYHVSSQDVKQKLMQRGIQPHKIHVTGIPVHPTFWKKENRTYSRNMLCIKDMPTVLIMGGGWGITDPSLVEQIIAWKNHIQIIFVCGNNEKYKQALEQDERLQHENVKILGFVSNISTWMDASDVLITKPGGMTCTEGLAKSIPMLFYSPIPGQEDANCHYFIDRHFAESIESGKTIHAWFTKLTNDYPAFTAQFEQLQKNHLHYQPDLCAKTILTTIEGSSVMCVPS
jgi:processive 1,2-diacylglycerol beta-glucosyltransferase